jgi:hypothetical protein
MAIATGSAIEFFGTQDTLGTSSAAVANGAYSIASDLSTWVNDDDAVSASVTLLVNFSVAPTASTSVNLYLRLLGVQGANDGTVPDANFQHTYVGSFPLNDSTAAQYITIDIGLPNAETSQNYEFYVENSSGQSLPAGWDIYVTPKAIGPHT